MNSKKIRALFSRILEFLEIDAGSSSIPPAIDENRRSSRGTKAPIEHRIFLAHLHHQRLKTLDARLGSVWTRKWLEEATELIETKAQTHLEPIR